MAAPLGSGGRFAALKNELAHRKGVHNPAALAAYIGQKKYGAKKMARPCRIMAVRRWCAG